jgi:hypothetical protein
VAWEVDGVFAAMSHCHCSMCRKNHGAAFATYAEAPMRSFRFTAGEDRVRRYRSSPSVERSFCSDCGSNLLFVYEPTPDRVWVAAGTCDDDPGIRPTRHIFVASKAPWFEITDGLAEEPAGGA